MALTVPLVADLCAELTGDMASLRGELRGAMADLRIDLARWLISAFIANAALMAGLVVLVWRLAA